MTVVDVRANIGTFSFEVLQRCGGDVRLLAVEPAPEPLGYLERNIRELFPTSRVTLLRCALADHFGLATFYYRPRRPVISSLQKVEVHDLEGRVEAIRGMLEDLTDERACSSPPNFSAIAS
jgi:FkbM family methyltransferase